MYTHSRCKFCRTYLQSPKTPVHAFCTRSCKRLYALHGTLNSMVINPFRNAILDNEIRGGEAHGAAIKKPESKPTVFTGELHGGQYTLNLFGEAIAEPVKNRPGRKRRK